MQNIKNILKEATLNHWPYPKTFEALKAAGLQRYEVQFANKYRAVFFGTGGTFVEDTLEGYKSLKAGDKFSPEGLKDAVIKHATKRTHYLDFLIDAAENGASHYKVDMKKRTVTYFNPSETESYEETVPQV